MQGMRTKDSVVTLCASVHLFRLLTRGSGLSCIPVRSDDSVARRTAVGLPDFVYVRYSSTGRHGDELNTGCGAAW